MTVTTSCLACKRTIRVPLDLFDVRPFAVCRDADLDCRRAGEAR